MKYLIIIPIVLLFSSFETYSQCCAAGNPSGADGIQSMIKKNEILIYPYYRHSFSKDYFHGSEKMDLSHIENSYYNFANISLSYGITNKLSINSEIGYFLNKTQNINLSNSKAEIQASGIGDLLLNIRYNLIGSQYENTFLVLSGGTRLPIGAFNETQNGVCIPISLQPSSGSLKLNIGTFFFEKIKRKTSFITNLNYEWSNIIEKDFLVYKYGHFLQYSTGINYTISKKFNTNALLKYEYRSHDKRENDLIIESTGGHFLAINPILTFKLNDSFMLIAGADLPLYKYVNGYQLTNQYAFQIGIKRIFSLCVKDKI